MSELKKEKNSLKNEMTEDNAPMFDREEWIQQKRAERDFAFELIDQAAEQLLKEPSGVKTCLELQSRFPRYSVGNILLLSVQKPDASKICDFRTWKENGVSIRKGETGIIILEPGNEYKRADGSVGVTFNTKHVFDFSQTTAETQPEVQINRDDRLLIKALVHNAPCEIKTDDRFLFPEGMIAWYDPESRTIFTKSGQESRLLFSEIARELALAHIDASGHERFNRDNSFFTATCVSYVLCRRNGVDVSAFSFTELPENIKEKGASAVREELGKIRMIANTISSDMENLYGRPKDFRSQGEAR